MRWVSFSGEFAFFSFGGAAHGIVAIGGNAYGIVAIGAIASAGVISIGMNAIGSVAAVGLNTLAPISISLINGLGIYTYAGVNGWGAWSNAGTNSSGITSHGGVNSDHSLIPAILVIVIFGVLSSVLRGARAPRTSRGPSFRLSGFVQRTELESAKVKARLTLTREGEIELSDGRTRVIALAEEPVMQQANAITQAEKIRSGWVFASLERRRRLVTVAGETSYRERPAETAEIVLTCTNLEPAPEPDTPWPKDGKELLWIIAWSARLSVLASIGALIFLLKK